jgi:hypothetical protein
MQNLRHLLLAFCVTASVRKDSHRLHQFGPNEFMSFPAHSFTLIKGKIK